MQSSDGLLCALACGCGEEAELKENKSHHWLHLDVVTMSWSWLSVARASGQRSNARGRLRLDDSRAPAESSHTMRSPILPSPPSPPPTHTYGPSSQVLSPGCRSPTSFTSYRVAARVKGSGEHCGKARCGIQ